MLNRNLILILLTWTFSLLVFAEDDLGVSVSGSEVENLLDGVKNKNDSAFVTEQDDSPLEKIIEKHPLKLEEKLLEKNTKLNSTKDVGQLPTGSFENRENYLEIDKRSILENAVKYTSTGFNLSYFTDNYSYTSPNNIIERTIKSGLKHFQTGFLQFRVDDYLSRSEFFNTFWSMGGGFEFNYAKGLFLKDGTQSSSQFRFWVIPIDTGFGGELPVFNVMKISLSAGPSVMVLLQNRGDLMDYEKGRNKVQLSYGGYVSSQLKFNFYNANSTSAYEKFIDSKITNITFNLEARYHTYSHFLDNIQVSGATFGAGFTVELL
jgi:hypothetical protein